METKKNYVVCNQKEFEQFIFFFSGCNLSARVADPGEINPDLDPEKTHKKKCDPDQDPTVMKKTGSGSDLRKTPGADRIRNSAFGVKHNHSEP